MFSIGMEFVNVFLYFIQSRNKNKPMLDKHVFRYGWMRYNGRGVKVNKFAEENVELCGLPNKLNGSMNIKTSSRTMLFTRFGRYLNRSLTHSIRFVFVVGMALISVVMSDA